MIIATARGPEQWQDDQVSVICRTRELMSTETAPNETENDLQRYHIVYQTASQQTVSAWYMSKMIKEELNIGMN